MKTNECKHLKKCFGLLVVALSWALALSLGPTGCTRIIVPAVDDTPPTVALTVLGESVDVRNGGADRTATVTDHTRYSLTVFGRDTDGGVRRVWVEGYISLSCGSSVHLSSHDSEVMEQQGGTGDTVNITLTQVLNWSTSEWSQHGECSPSETDYSLRATYVGYAENFSGVTSHTATLTLVYVVPAEWIELSGTTSNDRGWGMAVDANGNAYITGDTTGELHGISIRDAGETDIFVSKYDTDGNRLWTSLQGTTSEEYSIDIAVDTSGNAYITGLTDGNLEGNDNMGGDDIFVSKYGTNGNRLWTRLLGTTHDERGHGIAVDADGNAYITGFTPGNLDGNANTGDFDVFIAKYDTDGNRLWTRLFGTTRNDFGRDIAVDTHGNAYITGETEGDLDGITNAGVFDIFVCKYDADGNRLWTRLLGTAEIDRGRGVAVDTDGSAYITGYTLGDLDGNTNAGGDDILVAKYDTDGNKLWTKLFGTPENDRGNGVAVSTSGYVYLTGDTRGNLAGNTNAGGDDIFVCAYDADGNRRGRTRCLATAADENGRGIAIDPRHNAYITGNTAGDLGGHINAGANDIFIWRFSNTP